MESNVLSNGNRKIGNDTIIFNMTSAHDCPSRKLGLCKLGKKCYADKAERLYPAVLPYRNRQACYWEANDAITIANDILKLANSKRKPVKYFRLSEAGDFKNQEDVDKAELIAMHLEKHGITSYTYTARSDLDFSGCVSLLVKGSSHTAGNNGMTIARPKETLKTAQAFGELYRENGRTFFVCPGDCKICTACKVNNKLNVVFAIH
jgi:hypothetical protein